VSQAARIMGLDGKAKMSKSLGNYISLLDEPEVIRKKLRGAFTVESRLRKTDPGDPDICNIYALHQCFSPPETCKQVYEGCKSAELGCVDCKTMLAENMIAALTPIRERTLEVLGDSGYLDDVLRTGAQECQCVAAATMDEVRQAMGLR